MKRKEKRYLVTFAYSILIEAKNKEEAKRLTSKEWNNRASPYAEEMNISVSEGRR
jgi:hypothetical protein